jgi:hypothetical protein
MGEVIDYGLVALSETYTLSPEELVLLRGPCGKVFEAIRARLPRLAVSMGMTLPAIKIASLGEVLAGLPGGIVIPLRFGGRAGGLLGMGSVLKKLALGMIFSDVRKSDEAAMMSEFELAAIGKLLGRAVAEAFSVGFKGLFGVDAVATGAFSAEMLAAEALLAEDKVVCFSSAAEESNGAVMGAVELPPMMAMRGRLREAVSASGSDLGDNVSARRRAGGLKVEISAVLRSFEASFAYLRAVKPGHYIPLGKLKDHSAAVDIYAGKSRLGTGLVVEDRGWRRVLIQEK